MIFIVAVQLIDIYCPGDLYVLGKFFYARRPLVHRRRINK